MYAIRRIAHECRSAVPAESPIRVVHNSTAGRVRPLVSTRSIEGPGSP